VGPELWAANREDVAYALEAGMAPSLVDRSTLNAKRLQSMAQGCRDIAALPDPLGEVFDGRTLPNGMVLAKKRVPLGVLGVIFESRPNVTIDIGALALKSGNAVIMRGGKESLQTNIVLADIVHGALSQVGISVDAVQLITSSDRALVSQLLEMDDLIDLVIPRGGPGLQGLVKKLAKMPVAYGGIGVCHLYVGVQRPGYRAGAPCGGGPAAARHGGEPERLRRQGLSRCARPGRPRRRCRDVRSGGRRHG
jgi:glutamate-5-semialdehyde dehydrogenase